MHPTPTPNPYNHTLKTGKKIGTSAPGNVAGKRHKYLQLRDTLAVKMKQKKAETKRAVQDISVALEQVLAS